MARRRNIVTVASLAVIAILAGGWVLTSANSRGAVNVRMDDKTWACSDQKQVAYRDDLSGASGFVVKAKKLMECDLRFRITNHSAFAASIETVTLPLYGPDAGSAVVAQSVDGLTPRKVYRGNRDDDDLDASVNPHFTLQPGKSRLIHSHILFRVGGCDSVDSTVFFTAAPPVTVSVLGLVGGATSERGLYGIVGTADSSCDE